MVEVVGVEPVTPYCLQYNDIINYYKAKKITNGTGVMGQLFLISLFDFCPILFKVSH